MDAVDPLELLKAGPLPAAQPVQAGSGAPGKGGPPQGGWESIPHGKHGGYRKMGAGNKWEYYYPDASTAQQAYHHHAGQAEALNARAQTSKDPDKRKTIGMEAALHTRLAQGAKDAAQRGGKSTPTFGEKVQKLEGKAKAFFTDPKERKRVLAVAAAGIRHAPRAIIDHAVQGLKEKGHEFVLAGDAIKRLTSRQPLTPEHHKALLSLAVSLAASSIGGHGLDAALGHFSQNTALHVAARALGRAMGRLWMFNEGGHVAQFAAEHIGHLFKAGEDGKPQPELQHDPDAQMRMFAAMIATELAKDYDEGLPDLDANAVVEGKEPKMPMPGDKQPEGGQESEMSNTEQPPAQPIQKPADPLAILKGEVPLEKAGEGSRGGKVIGHTQSGKAVYQPNVEHRAAIKGYLADKQGQDPRARPRMLAALASHVRQDHEDAAKIHRGAYAADPANQGVHQLVSGAHTGYDPQAAAQKKMGKSDATAFRVGSVIYRSADYIEPSATDYVLGMRDPRDVPDNALALVKGGHAIEPIDPCLPGLRRMAKAKNPGKAGETAAQVDARRAGGKTAGTPAHQGEVAARAGGEGSRGGKVIGHTKSGKAIYGPGAELRGRLANYASAPAGYTGADEEKRKDTAAIAAGHAGWSAADHRDAATAHWNKTASGDPATTLAHNWMREYHTTQANKLGKSESDIAADSAIVKAALASGFAPEMVRKAFI